MSLKSIGKLIANITGIVTGFGPMFAKMTPTPKDDVIVAKIQDKLLEIADVVTAVEAMSTELGTVTGTDKARMSGPLVAQVVLRTFAASGKKLDAAKTDKFKLACAGMGGNMADILDCFED